MRDLPTDKHGKPYFKVLRYWMTIGHEQELFGRLIFWAGEYAFNDTEPCESSMSSEERNAWKIVKRDIDYQCEHHKGKRYRYQSQNQTDRFTAEYRLWREAVFKRDGFRCRACGRHGGRLNAHHIMPYAIHPELRTSIENGVTLCEECHHAVHRGEIKCPTGF